MLIITIWPLFALICLGFLMVRGGFPGGGFWLAAERLNYFVLFPALLFVRLASAPVLDPAIFRLGVAAILTIGIAALCLLLARMIWSTPAARFGPALQGTVRFNTYLGLAIVASIAGPVGVECAAVLLAVSVPLVNVLSILALTARGQRVNFGALTRRVLENPLIIACALGMIVAFSGGEVPFGTGPFFEILAWISLPLGLLCVGAALRPQALARDALVVVGNSALRLLAMPVLAALVGAACGLSGPEALVVVVFSAIPTAPTSYVLTRQLQGDGTLMAAIVTAQTLCAIITIPFILFMLGFS
ncbi:MAG: AEC family transporter [Paracoccaceae bacterium]|jgi:malonate transporter and related proteins|nr:MAG: transporter [Rhodobacter sp. BACL10 MAG-121220-bin24]MDO7560423.1 AEC family transporter [Paracoccaceae bacterium]MDO7633504.1 AEC family transporter [Paracoccaceae bacterium]MDO7660603.1 AEC family transporter [Paracoccaceae bacterium]MDO7732714.1 AEC family transporter [Paracoccaceae bacterium]